MEIDEKQVSLALHELTPPCSNKHALIERCHLYFANVQKVYVKIQKGRPKRFRIKSPLVQFLVEFPQGYDARAHFNFWEYIFYVKRCEDNDVNDRMGEVARGFDEEKVIINENKISIQLDIDSEFLDKSGKPVYRLNTSNKLREFVLGARVKIDDKWADFLSSPFTVRGVKRNVHQSISSPPSSSKIEKRNVLQSVSLPPSSSKIEEIERKVYIPLISELKEVFHCLICLHVATSPVFMSCCDQMIGCYHCYAQWAESSIMCPHCRSVEGKTVKNDNFNKIISLIRGPDEAE